MAKRKIDKLDMPVAAASEEFSEQAEPDILAEQPDQKVEYSEVKEAPKVEAEPPKEPAPEPAKALEKPVEQDEFGGDYNKLHKSYKESYGWNTRMAQEMAEMRREVYDLRASVTPKQPETKPLMTQEQLNEWFSTDPVAASAWLANTVTENKTRQLESTIGQLNQRMGSHFARVARNDFKASHADLGGAEFDQEFKLLFPEAEKSPELYVDVLDKAFETTYWAVKGKKASELAAKAKSQGKQEAELAMKGQAGAFVEGSSRAAAEQPFDPKKASSEDILKYGKAMGIPYLD